MAIDSDQRVEGARGGRREARRIPIPPLPSSLLSPRSRAPLGPAARRLGALHRHHGVAGGRLDVRVLHGQAQWFSVIGGILAIGTSGRPFLADRGRLRIVSQPISLILVGVALVVSSELMHAMGAGFLSYADALAMLSWQRSSPG